MTMIKSVKMKRRRLLAVLSAAVTVLMLSGCGSSAAPVSSGQAEGELFTLKAISQTVFNEINIADELGFFRDEGIQIKYTGILPKGVTEYQLLEQGVIDAVTSGHPPNMAQARLIGVKVKSVAPGMIDDPQYPHIQYLVKPDSPIQSLEEMAGSKVGINGISGCTSGYVQYYLKSKGLDPESVEFVIFASADAEALISLTEGLLDVTATHPPFAGAAVAAGEARQIGTSWDIFHSPGAGLSVRGFSEEFIEEHPEVVQGFVNAMYRARIWTNSHLDEAKQIVAKHLDVEAKDLSSFLYDENKNITPGYIEQWFDISESIGLWNKGDVLPADIIDNRFVPDDVPSGDATLHWEGK
jgi:ABC-type nitrate/sulfonate/bicarbonate transport system substrate-binding protein